MPVFFYIDPEMATDWNCRNVTQITLSYVFHKVGCCTVHSFTPRMFCPFSVHLTWRPAHAWLLSLGKGSFGGLLSAIV